VLGAIFVPNATTFLYFDKIKQPYCMATLKVPPSGQKKFSLDSTLGSLLEPQEPSISEVLSIKSFDVLSRFSQADQARVRRQKAPQNALRMRPNASNNLCSEPQLICILKALCRALILLWNSLSLRKNKRGDDIGPQNSCLSVRIASSVQKHLQNSCKQYWQKKNCK
jgi:hypothetical protein